MRASQIVEARTDGQFCNLQHRNSTLAHQTFELLSEHEIARNQWYPSMSLFCRDGTIIVRTQSFYTEPGATADAEGNPLVGVTWVSHDTGQTWSEAERFALSTFARDPRGTKSPDTVRESCVYPMRCELSDGSVLGAMGNMVNDKIRPGQRFTPYVAMIRRARSHQSLVAGDFVDDFALMRIPELAGSMGDCQNYSTGSLSPGGKAIEMDNGDLLLGVYGGFHQDLAHRVSHRDSAMYRCWVCISHDRGHSWNYLSTVASVDQYPLPEVAEGYCEADFALLGQGELLAVMRTGGTPTSDGSGAWYTPLVSCKSHDGGLTWSAPKAVHGFGVKPKVVRTDSGKIVCVSGRPGVYLICSEDDGDTWLEPHVITDQDGAFGEASSGNCSLGQPEPNVCVVLYDDIITEGGQTVHISRARRYRIH